jgi:hypothetical protein
LVVAQLDTSNSGQDNADVGQQSSSSSSMNHNELLRSLHTVQAADNASFAQGQANFAQMSANVAQMSAGIAQMSYWMRVGLCGIASKVPVHCYFNLLPNLTAVHYQISESVDEMHMEDVYPHNIISSQTCMWTWWPH